MSSPLPKPWTTRPATSCSIVTAVPARTRPPRKDAIPAMSGPRGPCPSLNCPDTTMPTTFAIRKPVNAQP